MGLNELREMFLKFFETKDHLRIKSASLVPESDKSLLLINSGMAPLKPYFTGQKKPPHDRVVNCQKCIRTPDIERVGKTDRHGTFFEMLGNFSFGDYFKDEAIKWSWEFCTQWLKLPEDKLWITIYKDDDEAFNIWHDKIGIPTEKIVRMGKEDNFWEIGLGPCGPCSEIYYDRGEKYSCGKEDCKLGCECDRYIEFWNLVFTQFDKDEEGNYNELENPNIDTGMGLERIAAIIQGVDNIFEVDTIRYVLDYICELTKVTYGLNARTDVSIRVITDHARSVTFLISDGVLPSNEGRGYVLRRLIRRAIRHGKLLGLQQSFLGLIAKKVVEVSKDAYPELEEKQDYILNIIDIEEKRFQETLEQGLSILRGYLTHFKETRILSGKAAFKLYDTYGFPLDLTKDILEDSGFSVDEEGFQNEMNLQKERARAARNSNDLTSWEDTIYSTIDESIKTNFVGYDEFKATSIVKVIIANNKIVEKAREGEEVDIVLDKTPFYAESGGQVSDIGSIISEDFILQVNDCKKVDNGNHIHLCKVIKGEVALEDKCISQIDVSRRMSIARNHTATHLLHKSLKNTLGNHAEQAGSLVGPDRLRFDFTHFDGLTRDEINTIEKEVNDIILESLSLEVIETDMVTAKSMGAIALFGEKYESTVRVVKTGDYSVELCGGTHLENTSQIGMFKIISESGIAAGVRRIEAISGEELYKYFLEKENLVNEVSDKLKTNEENLVKRIDSLLENMKNMEKEISTLKSRRTATSLDHYLSKVKEVKGVKYIIAKVENEDVKGMRQLGDLLKEKLDNSLIILYSVYGDKVIVLAMTSKKAVSVGIHAGALIKEITKIGGGSGGGRPDMAQGGIRDISLINNITEVIPEIIKKQIKEG